MLNSPEFKAGKAAGYKMEVRRVCNTFMLYADGVHFHPLTNFAQALELVDVLDMVLIANKSGYSICGKTGAYEFRERRWIDGKIKIKQLSELIVEVAADHAE